MVSGAGSQQEGYGIAMGLQRGRCGIAMGLRMDSYGIDTWLRRDCGGPPFLQAWWLRCGIS